MRYRRLGKTGLEVSVIGFGAEWIGGMPDDQVRELLKYAHDAGVNVVDCWMADPAIRSALGKALESERDRWIIQGHIGSTWHDGQYVRSRDLERVRAAFDDQLERLRTDYVDLGMIHYVDEVAEFKALMSGEFYGYVEELLAAGRIRHVGISTHNPDVLKLAAEDGRIEMAMFSVNPAFDLMPATDDVEDYFGDFDEGLAGMDPVRAEAYAACERNDVGLTVMKGYAGGRLLDAAKSPFGVAMTPVQCLHYCLTRPAVASVLIGVATSAQIDDALRYETASPSELDYASILAEAPKHAYYGQCTYCGHCAPCSAGINIALVNKFYDLAEMADGMPASVREHYLALDVLAGDCTACAACEPNCPFGVKISERMEKAARLFGR